MNDGSRTYVFGEFIVDPVKRRLLHHGAAIAITPKAFETLLLLVRNGGQIVSKETLLNEVWPDTFVEEATLSQNVFTVRRVLGQRADGDQFIETVPKRGYRFVAAVRESDDEDGLILEQHRQTEVYTEEVQRVSFSSTRRLTIVAVMFASTALLALGVLPKLFVPKRSVFPFSMGNVSRFTANGAVSRAVISPDGSYVVYATKHGAKESVWVKQVGSSREFEIAPAAETQYRGLTFSPDATYVYYSRYDKTNPVGQLYRSPVLGGTPSFVLSDIDSAVAISPGGKRLCFFRDFPDKSSPLGFSVALVIANVDGSEQKVLLTHKSIFYGHGPAWSPDGKTIVFPIVREDVDLNRVGLMSFNVDAGTERPLTRPNWNFIGQVSWTPAGDALLFDGWNESMSSSQLWQVLYPSGETRQLTNDLNTYLGSSFGGNSLVTIQSDRVAAFWVATTSDASDARQITSGAGDRSGEIMSLSWTGDEKLVYGSTESGQPDIWSMNADGGEKTQLTVASNSNLRPTASKDGRIAFVSRRTGESHIWLMDADGTNQKQLTNGEGETLPAFFSDGKWIAYIGYEGGLPRLWKIAIDGTQKMLLTAKLAARPVVSPDGKFVACLCEDTPVAFRHLAIISIDGTEPTRVFELSPDVMTSVGIRWTPDGKSIAFVRELDGVSNIWVQPIVGGTSRQLTHFTSAKIFRFAWSQNGSKLALERGVDVDDAVIIRRAS